MNSSLSNVEHKVMGRRSWNLLRQTKSRGAPTRVGARRPLVRASLESRRRQSRGGLRNPLSFASPNPWSALPKDVYEGTGRGKREEATTESSVDEHDRPKIYTIRDNTLKVLMHPDVVELHAVRVVHTPHGNERQLHLRVRVQCGKEELVVDVLVDTGAQVSLVRTGLFKEESLQPSQRPVPLKVANGEIMVGGTHEATISMQFWEHERLKWPDVAKRALYPEASTWPTSPIGIWSWGLTSW